MSTMLEDKTYIFSSRSIQEKNKNWKWQVARGLTIKCFDSEMIFFRLDWEEIASRGQKDFSEANNSFYKVTTA